MQTAFRERRGGTGTARPVPLGRARVRLGDAPGGRRFLEALAAMPLLPRPLLGRVSPSPTAELPGRGCLAEATARAHKLRLPGLVLSLFPHFPVFPHRWQQRWNRFCPSDHFSLKRPIRLVGQPAPGSGTALQVPGGDSSHPQL